jgi:hypothetical protein
VAPRQLRGTVRKNDLEGGIWELVCDDGERYQLRGGDSGLRVDGQVVSIDGKVDEDAMSIGMTGPILDVAGWSRA